MAVLTSTDLLKVLRNTYKRVNSKEMGAQIDVKKRPWIRFLESIKEDSGFEGGVILYPLVLSFNDPGQTWSGDARPRLLAQPRVRVFQLHHRGDHQA